MVNWNDNLPSDEARTRLLLPLVPKLIGTRGSKALENRRATMAVDWLIRVHAPAWLRLAGLTADADALAGLPEITDFAKTPSIMEPLKAAQDQRIKRTGRRMGRRTGRRMGRRMGTPAWDAAWDGRMGRRRGAPHGPPGRGRRTGRRTGRRRGRRTAAARGRRMGRRRGHRRGRRRGRSQANRRGPPTIRRRSGRKDVAHAATDQY